MSEDIHDESVLEKALRYNQPGITGPEAEVLRYFLEEFVDLLRQCISRQYRHVPIEQETLSALQRIHEGRHLYELFRLYSHDQYIFQLAHDAQVGTRNILMKEEQRSPEDNT